MSDIYDPNYKHDPSNVIHETAIIYDNVVMGKNNIIGPYCVIGSDGEIRGEKEFHGQVIIGSNNKISEHVTIQRPANKDAQTKIGDGNMLMAHTHIGHDAVIENNCELCSGVVIGGYVTIKNGAKIKLGAIIRNRKTVGVDALVGLGACVVKDVADKTIVVGNPARIHISKK